MDMTHRPGNLACSEARELLSDLIDVRRGEIPHPEGTRLSEPGMRAAVELHIAGCDACRAELAELEEVGAAFSDCNVGELPAQKFANYGQRARARMAGGAGLRAGGSRRQPHQGRRFWLSFAAAGLAAAAVLLALRVANAPAPEPTRGVEVAESGARGLPFLLPKPRTRIPTKATIEYYPPQERPLAFALDDSDPVALKRLQQHADQFQYLVFHEPLLGVRLKTTREGRAPSDTPVGLMVEGVEPGSPADAMGLQPNDQIVGLDYEQNGVWQQMAVTSGNAEGVLRFVAAIRKLGAGREVTIDVVSPRNGQYLFKRLPSRVLGEYE